MLPKLTLLITGLLAPLALGAVTRMPSGTYYVGVGIGDITGPAAEVNMMGYANVKQTTRGIHMRVYARAFLFADSPESYNRFVFVNCEMGMMSDLVKHDVIEKLKTIKELKDFYNASNVILSGTHTHSGTAGFFQEMLPSCTSLGFVKESHEQFVRGITKAIQTAHNTLKPAMLYLKSGQLFNTQINRSPSAYLRNPPAERAMYASDTDVNMHLLRIDDDGGVPMGMINWYPVHGVSMNFSNRLISGDNKGYASQMFERTMEPKSLVGQAKFVGAFAQAFEGDVSPNTAGAQCIDTGLPCDFETSSCNGDQYLCRAAGPGRDMYESTKIIGENQLKKALELFNTATDNGVRGNIAFIHKYVDMTDVTVDLGNGKTAKTCKPAMGYAFGGGTIDGPTNLPFSTQGVDTPDPFWESIRNLVAKPSDEMVECQKPKAVLIPTGDMHFPYEWHPTIVELQIAKVGQLVIVAVPGEFTTMSGRRMIAAITKIFADAGEPVQVVIAGLSNTYTHYVATPEEYTRQRYEGGSTIFGPYTLLAYLQNYRELAKALVNNKPVDEGNEPDYFKDKLWTLLSPVVLDRSGSKKFGAVVNDADATYRPGEVVSVTFVGAHPRNSMGQYDYDTHMRVEQCVTKNADPKNVKSVREVLTSWLGPDAKKAPSCEWEIVFTDAEWETRFMWERESSIQGTSRVTLEWTIPAGQTPGQYHICYYGHKKALLGKIESIDGCSRDFTVRSGH